MKTELINNDSSQLNVYIQKGINWFSKPVLLTGLAGLCYSGNNVIDSLHSTSYINQFVEFAQSIPADAIFISSAVLALAGNHFVKTSRESMENILINSSDKNYDFINKFIFEGTISGNSAPDGETGTYESLMAVCDGLVSSFLPLAKPIINGLSRNPLETRAMTELLDAQNEDSKFAYYTGKTLAYLAQASLVVDILANHF